MPDERDVRKAAADGVDKVIQSMEKDVEMVLEVPICPECGEPAYWLHEWMGVACSIAPVSENDTGGEWEFSGEDHRDFPEATMADTDEDGRHTLQCENGHMWQSLIG